MKKAIPIILLIIAIILVYANIRQNNLSKSTPNNILADLQKKTDLNVTKESYTISDFNLDKVSSEEVTLDNKKVVEIKEELFIAQCNDVYLNPEDYANKLIKLEGIYEEYTDEETNITYRYVIRYGPGCCGDDGTAGFEILFEGDKPKKNDWIEVIGSVEMIDVNGFEYIALRVSSLKILDVRGAEFVDN